MHPLQAFVPTSPLKVLLSSTAMAFVLSNITVTSPLLTHLLSTSFPRLPGCHILPGFLLLLPDALLVHSLKVNGS